MTTCQVSETLLAGGTPIPRLPVTVELVADLDGVDPGYSSNGTIISASKAITDHRGRWQLPLVPNAEITPAGTVYRVITVIERERNVRPFIVPAGHPSIDVADWLTDMPGALPNGPLSAEIARAQAAESSIDARAQAAELVLDGRVTVLESSGGLSTYRHVQSAPAAVWTIAHGLGYRPGGVEAFSSAGDAIVGRITHLNNNTLTISYFVAGAPAAFSGEAYIS